MSKESEKIIKALKKAGNKDNLKGMSRYGINTSKAFGTGMPFLRDLAKHYRKQHELASELWDTGFHEARILAGLIDDPSKVTIEQMDKWVNYFNSWDLCDQICSNLFIKTEYAYDVVYKWSNSENEFTKRAAFAMIAGLAVHDKKAEDKKFIGFLSLIEREAEDSRNFVKKAVNWALRQIGKRNKILNEQARETAERIKDIESSSAKWIAYDAIKELKSDNVLKRIK